jgi:hypothetical protein
LSDKVKPVDPLGEKWLKLTLTPYRFKLFKSIFKEELNCTGGYEAVEKLWSSFDGIWGKEELEHITATLKKLEK